MDQSFEEEWVLDAICAIDGVSKQSFIEEAVKEAIQKRVREDDFQEKFARFLQPVLDLMKELGIK